MAEGEEEAKMKINIKSTKSKDTVEVPVDCTVKQVRIRPTEKWVHRLSNF